MAACFRADVVGVDPAIDVALLQVDATRRRCRSCRSASPTTLRVGEWVCAIGNPLGYVASVTVGVVSFLGRKIFDPSLDALHPDGRGDQLRQQRRSARSTRAARSSASRPPSARRPSNIGFAIPIDQVMAVLPQLRERGRVSRGYIGVRADRRHAGAPSRAPASRPSTARSSRTSRRIRPLIAPGLRTYDVIAAIDDRAVRSDDELIRVHLGRARPARVGRARRVARRRRASRCRSSSRSGRRRIRRARRRRRRRAADANPSAGAARRDAFRTSTPRRATTEAARRRDRRASSSTSTRRARRSVARSAPGQVVLEINRRRSTTAAEFRAARRRAAARRRGRAVLVYDPALREQRAIVTVDRRSTLTP